MLLSLTALVIDLGRVYVTKQQMQAAADSAALAGAMELGYVDDLRTVNLEPIVTEFTSLNLADSSDQFLDLWNETVNVLASRQIPATFAKILGYQQFNVPATAQAGVFGVVAMGNLMPLIVRDGSWADSDDTVTLFDEEKEGAGNFAWIDWDGETSAVSLEDNIRYPAFSGVWWIGDDVPGLTGVSNSSGVRDAINYYIDNDVVMFFPLYDVVEGSGSGLTYNITRFAAFRMVSQKLPKTITGVFIDFVNQDAISGDGGPSNSRVKVAKLTG
jgi:hypothetical protein